MAFVYYPLEWHEREKEPLNLNSQSFRLLEVLADDGNDRIRCSIRHVRLGDKPTYYALSYVWGSSANPSIISVTQVLAGSNAAHSGNSRTGQELKITQNLNLALTHIRSHFTSDKFKGNQGRMFLWIDAICINQDDDVEKARQVRLMRDIYRYAHQTIIWLGPEENESSLGLQFMHKLLQAQENQTQKGDTRNIFQLPVRLKGTQVWTRDYDLPIPPDARYKALYHILDRPWFSRVWIIQEAAVSQNSVIHCGDHQVLLTDFLNAIQYCTSDLGCGAAYKPTNLLKATKLWNAWYSVQNGRRQSLLELLQQHRDFNATDPRDKVFALYGLAWDTSRDGDGLDIEVSYRGDRKNADELKRDTARLYTNIAQKIIAKSLNLDLLSYTRAPPEEIADHSLPSWVPDWRVADSHMSFRSRGAESGDYFPFEAAGPAEDDDITFDEKKRELHVRGYELDTIVEIGPVWSIEGGSSTFRFVDEYLRGLQHQRTFYEWERLCKARSGSKYRGTDEDMLSVYWHTLVAGGTYDGREVDLTHFTNFDYSSQLFRWIYLLHLQYVTVLYHGAAILMVVVMGIRNLVGKGPIDMTFQRRMGITTPNRRMLRSETGYVGLAPAEARVGDVLELCKGAMVPLVLRKKDEGRWELVGDAYVHGAMKGNAFVSQKCSEIVLV